MNNFSDFRNLAEYWINIKVLIKKLLSLKFKFKFLSLIKMLKKVSIFLNVLYIFAAQ